MAPFAAPQPEPHFLVLPPLRIIAFILGIFLTPLAASMLTPMLTPMIFDASEDLFAFPGRARSPPRSDWSG